jgi:hypothetical protein
MAMSTTTIIHEGHIDTIPNDASPGLVFLKNFLPVLDSLEAKPHISPFLAPNAQFSSNRDPPTTQEDTERMLAMRSTMLDKFYHVVSKVWEIPNRRGCTIIFDSESVTQFRGDEIEVRVAELNIWELQNDDKGVLKFVQGKSYMDPDPVKSRAKALFSTS